MLPDPLTLVVTIYFGIVWGVQPFALTYEQCVEGRAGLGQRAISRMQEKVPHFDATAVSVECRLAGDVVLLDKSL